MMLFRPQGLLPSRQRAAELAESTSTAGSHGRHHRRGGGRGGARRRRPTRRVDASRSPPTSSSRRTTVDQSRRRAARRCWCCARSPWRFGGVVAIARRVDRGPQGPDLRDHRPQRRRQDHAVQLRHRRLPAHRRARSSSTGGRSSGSKPHRITEAGVARTFQNIRLFPNMTAVENIMVGADARHATSVPGRPAQQPALLPRGARGQGGGHPPPRVRRHPPPGRVVPPATCPTATSAGSRSPGPWPPSPRCSSSTSPPPASTRPRSRR